MKVWITKQPGGTDDTNWVRWIDFGTGLDCTLNPTTNTLLVSAVAGGGGAWGSITGTLSAQADLQTALDGKSAVGHDHDLLYAAINHNHDFEYAALIHNHDATYAPLSHTHSYEAAGAVAAHEAASDPHPQYTTTAEASAAAPVQSVAGKTGAVSLVKGDVGLGNVDNTSDAAKPISTATQTALDGKSPTSHNHDASYEAAGAVAAHAAAADPHAGYQRESEKGVANGYASLGADGKVPSAQLPASGSDPWTYLRLSSDFTTTSATAVDITGLGFTPSANTRYEVEAVLRVRTATTTVGPRPGVAWPTGCTDGVADVRVSSSATAEVQAKGNINAAVLAPVGGLPSTTLSYPAFIKASFDAGATPGSTFRAQLASETAGTTVTAKAGSFLKYRTVP